MILSGYLVNSVLLHVSDQRQRLLNCQESFGCNWESQQQIREELKYNPDELRRQGNKLHQATFNNKAERFLKRGNKDKSTKFRNLTESHCEDALEILQEIVDADASLHMQFNISASLGDAKGRKNKETIAEIMNTKEISEAQKLARECVRKKYNEQEPLRTEGPIHTRPTYSHFLCDC